MAGLSGPGRSSLDRLKALDALPDLASQVEEALQLCTHSSRAEMILRWLLGKFKSLADARAHAVSWDLLSNCIRLLPLQRAASLLGQNGFIEVLVETLSVSVLPLASLMAVARPLDVLLGLAQDLNGSAIKSLLSINADVAATICASWWRHVHNSWSILGDSIVPPDGMSILQTPLQLWDLRRRTNSDDTLFNSTCLVPVMLLLAAPGISQPTPSFKRKRGLEACISSLNSRSFLETLVARHTILPARDVFFESSSPNSRQTRRLDREVERPAIKETLGPLKMAILNENSEQMLNAIPLVLDVALRSVSTPTPKQHFHERPWIEHIFTVLCGCFYSQQRLLKNMTLRSLIEVLRRHAFPLSIQVLSSIVKTNALSDPDSHQVPDWHLIADVIELNRDISNDRVLVDLVFDELTSDTETAVSDPLTEAASTRRLQLLRDGIAVPIIRNSARGRQLEIFIESWQQRLLRPPSLSSLSVWRNLGLPVADVLEDALTSDQISDLFTRLTSTVKEMAIAPDQLADIESQCKLHASVTILEALLRGTRSEELPLRLQGGLEQLLSSLMTLADLDQPEVVKAISLQIWQLLNQVFKQWFSIWAVKQENREKIAERGLSLLAHKSIQTALARLRYTDVKHENLGVHPVDVFIATLCSCFQQYDDHGQLAQLIKSVTDELGQMTDHAISVYLRYPELFAKMPATVRKRLFSRLPVSSSQPKEQIYKQYSSIGAAAGSCNDHAILDDITAVVIDHLQAANGDQQGSRDEPGLLHLLIGIDPGTFTPQQRKGILDTILDLPVIRNSPDGPKQLTVRFSLISALLAHPSKEAEILKNATNLKKVIDQFGEDESLKNESAVLLASHENLRLLEEIACLVVEFWQSGQNQLPSRERLTDLSHLIRDLLQTLSSNKGSRICHQRASLAFVKTCIEKLEARAEPDLKKLLVYRDQKTLKQYLKALLKRTEALAQEYREQTSTDASARARSADLCAGLDALLAVPDALWEISGLKNDGITPVARKLLSPIVDEQAPARNAEDKGEATISIEVICFRLLCRQTESEGTWLVECAEKLLQQQLTPVDHRDVLSAFADALQRKDLDSRLAVALSLANRDADGVSSSTLLLLWRIVKGFNKEDLESSPNFGSRVLQSLLPAASSGTSLHNRRTALQLLAAVLKEKPFLINQYGIECTLTTVHALLQSSSPPATPLYVEICSVLSATFTNHRSCLQGRFHLLVVLFQAMLTSLFATTSHRSPTLAPAPSSSSSSSASNVRHARSLARLVESFCNPPPLARRRARGHPSSELIDDARKAQAYAGQYARYILHHYCVRVLADAPGDEVRQAFTPGLWALIEAVEAHDRVEGVRSLSAAMNNSERAVLRSVYEDWKRFGKWEGL